MYSVCFSQTLSQNTKLGNFSQKTKYKTWDKKKSVTLNTDLYGKNSKENFDHTKLLK
jgi:hypothetical protein